MIKLFASVLIVLAVFQINGSSQTTEFTFQGGLTVATIPANGNHDFEFSLFDALSGGNQIGGTIAINNVAVAAGVFSVKLNFGSQFPGADRYLQIKVRPSGQQTFTTLSPLLKIDSSPYSIKSVSADNSLQLGGVAANQFVITTDPRMSDARDPLPGSTSYIRNSTDRQPTSNFSISGDGTAGGTLSGNAVNALTQYNIAGQRVFSIAGLLNTFVGAGTGTSGRANSFFGSSAGAANTSGQNNSFFGAISGTANTTGQGNSFFGARAGLSNTTGDANSFFGFGAGESTTTGLDNAFFGTFAGVSNTVGQHNSFFGRNAGFANTSGVANSFFGRSAGAATTMGSSNSFFGYEAGTANTLGAFNSFFGANAGDSNTTGANNSFFGRLAGAANTTGQANSFFGSNSGDSNTIGDNNAFYGAAAGGSNTIGSGNSFFGTSAGISNTLGDQNSFFGRRAGEANTTGQENSFVGYIAGITNTTGNGNTFLGSNAGNNNTSGNFNTVIGISSNVGSGNLTFATAIGANAVVSTSNTIQLGRASGADDVVVPGILRVRTLGNAGSTALCRNNADGIAPCSSSARYKSSINFFSSGIDLIKRLRPVSFVWNDGGMPDLGLTAEEVAEIEPLLVTYNKNSEVEGVKYDRIGVVLINAVKEQQAEIDFLRKQIDAQGEAIDALKKILCSQSPGVAACRPRK